MPQLTDVRVSCVNLDALATHAATLYEALSAGERKRASSYCLARDRTRFIARRVALRELLAGQLSCRAGDLEFATGPHGKPELYGELGGAVHFNCSHSHGLALIALAQGTRVGIDVERVRPVAHLAEIGRRHFTSREWSVIEEAEPVRRMELFFRAWTLKEAYLKATGEGLSRAPESLELSFGRDGVPQLCAVDGDAGVTAHWASRALAPAPGYAGAIVIERPVSWTEALLSLVRPHLPSVEEVDVDVTTTAASA